MKRDGHTHTHYCLHSSGEEAELFVIRAIELGFETYSFTEHVPLPERFLSKLSCRDEIKKALKIRDDDPDAYLKEMKSLQKKYRDRIRLLVGFEVDYLSEGIAYTRDFLREYGKYLDDALLSVHFLNAAETWYPLDHGPADFEEAFFPHYGSFEQVQLQYYQAVKEAVLSDLGPYKPKRISHFTLCNKFQHLFNPELTVSEVIKKAVLDLLETIRKNGFSLDVNAAGLFKKHCREIYPSPWIIAEAKARGIPLVYGSDAHAVEQVGRGYDVYEKLAT